MRHSGHLLCLAASIATAASEPSRPRGVGPEFAKFYKDSETFTCISNPSIKIPFSRVNDDFCDCPDGSDEPGTAACSYLSPLSPSSPGDTGITDTINATLALPGFYCKNKGHTPTYVPFTAVNDGICDYDLCCDGSEEYGGLVKCEDKCGPIGQQARKDAEARQKTLSAATRKRKELVTDAARLRKEIEDRIADLHTQIQGAELQVQNTKEALAETEKRERNRVVRGADGPLGSLVEQARTRSSELRDSLIRVRGERDSARTRLQELESLLTTFKEEYNPNFNDEGVKRAVRAWEDYAARDKGPEPDAGQDTDLDEITKTDEESGLDWEAFTSTEQTSDPELELLYSFEAYLPLSLRTWVDTRLRALRQSLIDNGILANNDTPSSSSGSTHESKALQDARTAVNSAENDLRNMQNDRTSHTDDLGKDYGKDDVFRPLKGQCISTDSGEYTYELCFMDKTVQKSKKGGGHTSLGNFAKFETVDVDHGSAEIGSGRRLAMKYDNGQHCWNGPSRSTLVVLACAEDNKIFKITEEEKCVYRMEVGTPAACGFEETAAVEGVPVRDEL
ncbi:hypothetical protein K461DRAFT_267913 [Myriangium duriaei CBS 260.36]|uniref:Glucosidase 2 subunit beta n=1 Tax=Myriangium duriaei CBS 260.36 TaxID=1168546 RepID=A0A9P4J6M2_9PEZI|nr:hypothetical protein K461DRAFT_267913 [Myriangium duriaei CBS 260.36]